MSSISKPGFPYVLTIAAATVFAICIALGVWQVKRFHWKQQVLARIAAQQSAPPLPIGPILERTNQGEDLGGARVFADCTAAPPAPAYSKISSDKGNWITRARSVCRLRDARYDGILIDRGLVQSSEGSTTPATVLLPAPVHVVGVIYYTLDLNMVAGSWGGARLAPYILVADHETPPAPGVTPAPYPDPASNLQYVGEYAPTWFGLAGVLCAFYGAMLWRRLRSPR